MGFGEHQVGSQGSRSRPTVLHVKCLQQSLDISLLVQGDAPIGVVRDAHTKEMLETTETFDGKLLFKRVRENSFLRGVRGGQNAVVYVHEGEERAMLGGLGVKILFGQTWREAKCD